MSLKDFSYGPLGTWYEALSTLEPCKPQGFPKFPTVQELLDQEGSSLAPRRTATVPVRRNGMFEILLQSQPEILLAAVGATPDRFDPALEPLLSQIVQGRRLSDLTPEEMDLLDSSTLLEMQTPQPKKEGASTKTAKRREGYSTPVLEEGERPETDLPPYWWL